MSAEQVNAVDRDQARSGVARFVLPLLMILVTWAGFGWHRFNHFTIAIGSIHEPTYESMLLALAIAAIGMPATYLSYRIALRILDVDSRALAAVQQAVSGGDRRTALLVLGALGTLVPIFVRKVVLNDAPMTDDEASYRFGAELLASGRLWVPSPSMPVFFDNGFMINDGKLYSQYFLGWPALLSIGVLLHIPGLINPLLSGLTTVLLAVIAERRFGAAWGRVAAMLFICSPFIAVSAATQMSHTATTFALAMLLFAVDSVADQGASWRMSALVALSACLAFFVRPATGLGFGTPLVLSWLFSVVRRPGGFRHLLTFLAVAIGPGLLFLWINEELTGSPWRTGYHAGFQHGVATYHRFVSFGPQQGNAQNFLYFFVRTDPGEILSKFIVALVRLWPDAWGFPFGLALALFTPRAGARRLIGPFLGLMIAHIPLPDAGIDTFGPVHFTELMIALTIASTGGLKRLHQLASRVSAPGAAPALLIASVLCSVVFYGLPRFTTLALLASDIRSPFEAFESAPAKSIIFNRAPFAPPCLGRPGSHYVFFRPNNDPDLQNPRLWVNHINLEADRKLLASMPGYRGFLIRHHMDTCHAELVPIEQANPAEFPPATFLIPGDLGEIPRPR